MVAAIVLIVLVHVYLNFLIIIIGLELKTLMREHLIKNTWGRVLIVKINNLIVLVSYTCTKFCNKKL